MACCDACARGLDCTGGACRVPVRSAGTVGVEGGYSVGSSRPSSWYQRAVRGAPTWGARGRGVPGAVVASGAMRDAGAVAGLLGAGARSDADDVQFNARAPEVEAGIQASIWRGVARELSRSAGDPVPRTPTGRDADQTFDPRDPASMTRDRWASMSEAERRAWIDASVRSDTERTAMYREAITGAFDSVRRFVDAEKEKRLAEIRETAATERERIRADSDVERARIDAEVRRAQLEAERLRAEAERLRAESGQGGDDVARRAAEERARAAEAEAARLRELQGQGNGGGDGEGWSTGAKVGAAVGGVAVLGVLGWAVHEWMEQKRRERAALGLMP